MHILITGAAGFIGQILAQRLLSDPSHTLILTDVIDPPTPPGALYPQNARCIKADICTSAGTIVSPTLDAAFVFHGIMSSGAESDFDLGMRVNIDATRALLEALRRTCPGIRVIYASSQAVYGTPLPAVVDEKVVPTPASSYGAEKLVCEVLVNEYSRRGFVDGLCLRFPTISVRPGKPTAAASSFLSGMIREPLGGVECVVPVEDRGFESWLCSPRTLLVNLVHALRMDTKLLPSHVRQINLPGICVTVQEMMDALEKVGGRDKLSLIKEKADPALLPILQSWPTRFDNSQALSLGFQRDQSFEKAVRDYIKGL
jgi:nucleoside-diphosphate-sugar epimerase